MRQTRSPWPVVATALWSTLVLAPWATARAQQLTPQFLEDTASRHVLAASGPRVQVCERGARWIRLGFARLALAPGDSLTLSSSGGEHVTFADGRWNQRRFHARALRGECVLVTTAFSTPSSGYALADYESGSRALAETPVTVAGAADMCDDAPEDCIATSDLIVGIAPSAVFTAGDHAYGSGTLGEFNLYYAPAWGRFKELTSPAPGNHDYVTARAAGYFDYFNGVGQATGPAGDRSLGYYSYDVGEWHFIALNSRSGGTIGSSQLAWLDADLAANSKPCTAAYFHYPLLSRGRYAGYATMKPFWDRLYAAKADLVLVGHDHNYQRYAPMDAFKVATTDGLRQIVIGTGGAGAYPITGTHALLEASRSGTRGVLRLDLTASGYTASFVPVAGEDWTDSVSGGCNRGAMSTPDFRVAVASPTLSLVRGASATQAVTLTAGGGFGSTVRLSVSGLPAGTSYTFSPNPVTPPVDGAVGSTLTLRATSTTWTGTLSIKVKGTYGTRVRSTTFRLTLK